jgi:hypothetical protein
MSLTIQDFQMSLTIQEMRLLPHVAKAAQLILKEHPDANFTSGRRDARSQARVMAANVVQYGSGWLKDVYNKKHPKLVALLMTYVEENPELCSDVRVLANGFYEQMAEHYSGNLSKFPHLVGRAFDLAWPRDEHGQIDREKGEAICSTILALPSDLSLELLLKKEGALDVIHAQFGSVMLGAQV